MQEIDVFSQIVHLARFEIWDTLLARILHICQKCEYVLDVKASPGFDEGLICGDQMSVGCLANTESTLHIVAGSKKRFLLFKNVRLSNRAEVLRSECVQPQLKSPSFGPLPWIGMSQQPSCAFRIFLFCQGPRGIPVGIRPLLAVFLFSFFYTLLQAAVV